MTSPLSMLIGAIGLTAAIVGTLEWYSRSNVTTIGFWFNDDVTFEVYDPRRFASLTAKEQGRIKDVARKEVEYAFSGFRVRLTEDHNAFFRVGVQQLLQAPDGSMARGSGVAAQSHVLGML